MTVSKATFALWEDFKNAVADKERSNIIAAMDACQSRMCYDENNTNQVDFFDMVQKWREVAIQATNEDIL
jgi:hypothetical protein